MSKSIIDEQLSTIKFYAEKCDAWAFNAIMAVVDNPFFQICTGSGSPHKHHYGNFGLLTHTAEVIKLCSWASANLDCKINNNILLCAAAWHDFGKILDYKLENGVWMATPIKDILSHINTSAADWYHYASNKNIPVDETALIHHCILAHHGEHGPMMPQTPEAWILHTCDQMSARVNQTRNFKADWDAKRA